MLWADALRGWDSTGLFSVNKHGNGEWIKAKGSPGQFLALKSFNDILTSSIATGKILIGHNRKATQGTITDSNAHPFIEGNIILVHNGFINNHTQHAKTEVDSHAIAHLLNTQTPEEVFNSITGAYALVWYNIKEKKLYMVRNSQRPLWVTETEETIYISSEKGLSDWIISRLNVYDRKDQKEPWQLDVDTLYHFDIEKNEFLMTKLPPKVYTTSVQNWPHSTYGNGYCGEDEDTPYAKKENLPVLLANSGSKQETPCQRGNFRYIIGDIVEFRCDSVTPTWERNEGTHTLKNLLKGTDRSYDKGQILCALDSHNFSCTAGGQYFGKVGAVIKQPDGMYEVHINPQTVEIFWQRIARNKTIVTPYAWTQMGHKCWKCKGDIDEHDLTACQVTYKKGGKHKLICPDCTELLYKTPNIIERVLHAVH